MMSAGTPLKKNAASILDWSDAMGNRSTRLSDNMDMLLDTMCNLLGGIIVIAILLAIITNAAKPAPPPPPVYPAKFEEFQQKEIESLASRIAQMRALIGNATNAVVDSDLWAVMAKIGAAEKEIKTMLKQIQSVQQQVKARKPDLASIAEEVLCLRKQLAALSQKARTVRVPMAHKIRKTPVFAALRNGQFYLITDMSQAYRAGASRPYDTASVEVRASSAGSSRTVLLRNQAGQPVQQGAESQGALRKMLSNMDGREEFVAFAVYPDSYAEFNYVKSLVVACGIDYHWLPMEANEPIIITTVTGDSVTAL